MSRSFPIQSGQGNGAFGTSPVARGYLAQLRKRKGLNFYFSTAAVADFLVSFWRMDELRGNRRDLHYPRYTLGETGEVTTGAGLIIPKAGFDPLPAALFDPTTGNFLSRKAEPDFLPNHDFTVGIWVFPTDTGTDRTIINKGNEWAITRSTTNVPTFKWANIGSTGSGTAPINTWTLIWIRYLLASNGRSVTTNGGAYGSTQTDANFPANFLGDLFIGKAISASNNFAGRIGPIAYWRREVTDGDRVSYYNGGLGQNYPIQDL